MLDWSKIDNDKTFQRLISHLVSLECRTPGFLPSSPYIGADGGYDAYVDNYPEENLSGDICIQAKYTKHSLKKAYELLRGEVVKELDKAKRNKVDHVIMVTNAELNVDYIKDLISLNTYSNISLYIWDREKLTLKIEKQPFLRSYYFSSPAIALFIPSSVYFEEVEKGLVDDALVEIDTITSRTKELLAFLGNENKKVFIIHAPGGYGKSRFLSELPKSIRDSGIDREVWFIRDGVGDIRQAFSDEIGVRESADRKHKYVFVIDDADRADDIKELLLCIIRSGIDAKLVMSLRTAGKFAIEEILVAVKGMPISTITSIPEWTNDEFRKLLRAVVQKDKVRNEDDIILTYPNPFFLVKIGLMIRRDPTYDFDAIKQEILQSLLNDTKNALKSEQVDVDELLLHLTLISPINMNHGSTMAKLAQKLNVNEQQLVTTLERLVEGGVLRQIGSILRFIPDMIGDIFLLERMQSLSENSRNQAFLYWFDTHSKNIFCNLGATLKYGDDAYLMPIVADVVSAWINNADKYDDNERHDILKNLEDVCGIIPDRTLDLLWMFLDCSDLSTDAYGPIINRLIYSSCSREKIVKVIEGVREKSKLGTYDNYKPNTLVRESVTPLQNDINKKVIPILRAVDELLKENENMVEYAEFALQEILASTHEYSRSTYGGIEFGSRALNATDEVLAMRSEAIEMTKRMLLDTRLAVRLAATKVVEGIGKTAPSQTSDVPLADKITEERQEMLEFIDSNELIDREKDWSVLSSYEDLLFSWWARQVVPDDKAVPLICKFAYDSEFRIYRFYNSRWDLSDDVQEIIKIAPSEGRWNWAAKNIMGKKWYLTIDDFEKDAKFLSHKYSTAQNSADFLDDLGQKVTVSSANALFLRAWFKQSPEVFKEIRLVKDLWAKIPLLFKYTITYDLVQEYPDIAETIIKEVLLTSEISLDEAKIAIDILSYDLPSVDKYSIIKSVSEKNIDELNLTIIERMRFIGDKISAKEMAEIVSIVMSHLTPNAQARSIDNIAFILHNKDEDYIKNFLDVTRDIIYSTLVHDVNLNYHDFEVLALMFSDVKELMDFIEARLEHETEINKYSEYQAVPFDGITLLDKAIKNYDDFFYVNTKVLEWNDKYKGIAGLSVKKVFGQIVSLKDESGKLYFENIKDKFYNKEYFSNFLSCLSRLSLERSHIEIFDEAIQESKKLGFEEDMEKLLKSKIYPEGVWSSSVGEVPPIYIEIKEVFQRLKDNAPAGRLSSTLGLCIQAVEKMINDDKMEEENRFHTR